MSEILGVVFVTLALASAVGGLIIQFDVVGHVRFWVRLMWAKLTWRRRAHRTHAVPTIAGDRVVVRGKPGQLVHLDDFRLQTSGGTGYVSVMKGDAVLPESGELVIATIKERNPR